MLSVLQSLYDKSPQAWFDFLNHEVFCFQANCYTYALSYPWAFMNIGAGVNPGFSRDPNVHLKSRTVQEFINALVDDGLTLIKTESIKDAPPQPPPPPSGHYLTAAFVTVKNVTLPWRRKKSFEDKTLGHYHIMRQHADGSWTERNGNNGKVRQCDSPSACQATIIIDNQPAFFVGYFSVPNSGLNFWVPRQLAQLENSADPRITKYPAPIKALIDFDRRISFSGTKAENKRNLEQLFLDYPDICSNLISLLENENRGWQKDILGALADANKGKLQQAVTKSY